MKSRGLLLLSLFFFAGVAATAQSLDGESARKIAVKFYENESERLVTRSARQIPVVKMAYSAECEATGAPAYYVFNRTDVENGGFVIVSATEGGEMILGYSDSTPFDYDTAPAEVKSLMYMLANNMSTEEVATRSAMDELPAKVAPFVKSKWNQQAPYNLMCPSDGSANAVTGCGATCISQVAYYYKYPEQGSGSHKYTSGTNGYQCSFDFGSATFDYDNMVDRYGASATTAQKNAVAELMYAAGVAANTDYKMYPRSSTCTLNNIAVGLRNYFQYDAGMSVCRRDYYTLDGWKEMLCREMSEGRPVIYQGIGSYLGHVFILDGYNSSKLFHINWGWGGTYDGYYNVGNLSVGNYGALDTYLWVIRGIKPAEEGSLQSSEMYAEDLGEVAVKGLKNRTFNISIKNIVAQNYVSATMDVGYLVLNQDGDTVDSRRITRLTGRSEVGNATGKYGATRLTNGCYRLIPAGKQTAGSDWQAIRFLAGARKYVNIDVRADSAFYYSAEKSLTATDIVYALSEEEGDSLFTITCNIANSANSAYNGELRIEILSADDATADKHIVASLAAEVAAKGSEEITFSASKVFPSGKYYIFVVNGEEQTVGMDIQELETSISTDIDEAVAEEGEAVYYDLSGRRVKQGMERGLLIKRDSNGKVRKVML